MPNAKCQMPNERYKVALIIIYNHRYDDNIERIENIYNDRFANIYHLVPFYNGTRLNVISVYDNSYYFQGYVAQGFKSFFNESYTHYIFIADDLMLNPLVNQYNYLETFRLNQKSCFIPGFITFHSLDQWWPRVFDAFNWKIDLDGLEVKNQLPDYDIALQCFAKFNLEIKPMNFAQIGKKSLNIKNALKFIFKNKGLFFLFIKSFSINRSYSLPYPLVGSYSDIFIVSSTSISQFCHYCGVFSATKLFVEVAIPTALVLSSSDIITENDLEFKGKALWIKKDYKELVKYKQSINKLIAGFPLGYLYLHPIKLSKWTD